MKIIGVCSKVTYQMITTGKLPCIKISVKKVVIPKAALGLTIIKYALTEIHPS
jgi:hypothetical protein